MYNQKIEWKFHPPYASNFSGAVERHILSVQRAFQGTLALLHKRTLDFDEFITLVQEAGAIVNNTPLTEVSDDVSDPEPITPAHLLLLRRNTNPPEFSDLSENDLVSYGKLRFRKVQYLAEMFWQRWRAEYITSLHKRHKWKTRVGCIKVGDIVLVKDKKPKRNDWQLGRIIECKRSDDGLVRSVMLRLPSLPGSSKPRTGKRCIHDLVLLVPSAEHRESCFSAAN